MDLPHQPFGKKLPMTDSILAWNEVALEANRVSHTEVDKSEQNGPTLSSRALAIVHLAMYDAYARVRGNPSDLPPYLPELPPAPADASPQAAVAAAAYETLKSLFPSQTAFLILNWQNLATPLTQDTNLEYK